MEREEALALIEARVAAGIGFLGSIGRHDWWEKGVIDTENLDINQFYGCVLGQLYGEDSALWPVPQVDSGCSYGRENCECRRRPDWEWMLEHGLVATGPFSVFIGELNEAWVAAIESRRDRFEPSGPRNPVTAADIANALHG